MKPNQAIIHLEKVVKVYQGLAGEVRALKGVDLSVASGEYVVITGKSGSGKTTLINMISGLDQCTAGKIRVGGAELEQMNLEETCQWRLSHVGVVFQTFELLPTLTVVQNVMLPMDFAADVPLSEHRERAMLLLEKMGIADHADKFPSAVSGGQQQRIAIARALANNPPIILADEPTGSLDSVTTGVMLEIFEGLVEQGKTVVLVTHDNDIASRAPRTLVLSDGEFVDEKSRP